MSAQQLKTVQESPEETQSDDETLIGKLNDAIGEMLNQLDESNLENDNYVFFCKLDNLLAIFGEVTEREEADLELSGHSARSVRIMFNRVINVCNEDESDEKWDMCFDGIYGVLLSAGFTADIENYDAISDEIDNDADSSDQDESVEVDGEVDVEDEDEVVEEDMETENTECTDNDGQCSDNEGECEECGKSQCTCMSDEADEVVDEVVVDQGVDEVVKDNGGSSNV